ncbi:hypothetical protein CZ787_14030 [Halomonas citrativorans]|uniref:Uncharacterized protein n=1 Tax=Halomonas citrativorans TaxID=2742612 RepID=A0A1R4I3B4_9GAMM|nr:hypothetical protein CZ787_14030 [Halomonas citrativorans]
MLSDAALPIRYSRAFVTLTFPLLVQRHALAMNDFKKEVNLG